MLLYIRCTCCLMSHMHMPNAYIIDTSITAVEPPQGDRPFDDERIQISYFRIPRHVLQMAAEASIDVFGYRWPVAFDFVPDHAVLRVDHLYRQNFGSIAPRMRWVSLRIEGQEARRMYWEARGNQYALERDRIPAAYIQMEYDAFINMHQKIEVGRKKPENARGGISKCRR